MDLSKFLEQKAKEVNRYIKQDAPRIVGKMARDHFKQSFQDEGFTDDTYEKWDEVKRRADNRMKRKKDGTVSKRQAPEQTRKILTDSGELQRSIQSEVISSELVEIGTDLEDYPKAHNEGTDNAGRNHSTKIPKRQFIGESKQLEKEIINKFEKDLTKILND